jgi:UDP-2,3-diacylglucosamine pyrophosphatase LpxH
MDALRPEGQIHCTALWISDVHLGSSHCKADYLLQLLARVHTRKIYLVGDIVDMWAMSRRVYWPEAHNQVLRQVLKLSLSGIEIIYIPGNHDANFREFCGSEFGHVKIRENAIHVGGDGRRYLVTHGDELDYAVRYSRINRMIGDMAYDGLMVLNRWLNKYRAWTGKPYWSLAGWVKSRVGQAEQAIRAYQEAAVSLARHRGVDGIICGHLHQPLIRRYENTLYCNDGDWVENCTALVEDARGRLRLIQVIGSGAESEQVIFASV